MSYNIFICYRGAEGGVFASNIYSDLCLHTNDQLKVFFAPRCVPHGQNFKKACLDAISEVQLVVLILTNGFFDNCKNDDDIVYNELKTALAKQEIRFLPILMPDFDFKNVDLSELFDETEVDRIKHISAIKFTDVYSFSSVEMLIPILRDMVGDYAINNVATSALNLAQKRMHIADKGKDNFFSAENIKENMRLKAQQQLLMDFDMPIYEKCLEGKDSLAVLDLGCGSGTALMNRLGNNPAVKKIIGIEFDEKAAKSAAEKYGNENVKFYCLDIEAEDFSERLMQIMNENGIEKFDFVNLLAVMSHLKSPFKLLRIIKKFCSKKATIFIRNIDDGLNICYPDDGEKFMRALSLLSKCGTTGYRYSGRELYTLLKRSGYNNICLQKSGLSSVGMDYEQKSAFFDVIFMFIKQGIVQAAKENPENSQLRADRDWFLSVYEDLEEAFLSEEFFISFGFILFTAEV